MELTTVIDTITKSNDLNILRTIIAELYRDYPNSKDNIHLKKLSELLNAIIDVNQASPTIKDQLIELLSKGISEQGLAQLQTSSKPETDILNTLELIELEKNLFQPLPEQKKLSIIQFFKEKKAVPNKETLHYLLTQDTSTMLKKNTLMYFATQIDRDFFTQALTEPFSELHQIALQVSGTRNDLPITLFENIILNPRENIQERLTALNMYNSLINTTIFEKISLDKHEDLKLRNLAIQKSAIRSDLSFDFLKQLLMDPTEKLNLKKTIVITYKNRLPLEYLQTYFLNKDIAKKEKYEMLKLVTARFGELNNNGSLDILLLQMKELAEVRRLLLESKQISDMCIKQLLFDKTSADELKIDIFSYCKKELSKKNYKELFDDLVKDTQTSFLFRIQILTDFTKNISVETILFIIKNKEDALDFRLAVLNKFKDFLKEHKATKPLEAILTDSAEPLVLKNYLLKFFHKNFTKNIVSECLLMENVNQESVKKLLISLKNVNFFIENSLFFRQILTQKLPPETLQFLFDNFKEFFEVKHLYILIIILSKIKPFEELIQTLSDLPSLRLELFEYMLKNTGVKQEQKFYILNNFYAELSTLFLCGLLTDTDFSPVIKQYILNAKPRRTDLNGGGELNFIFSDPEENPEIRLLIYQRYKDLLNDSIVRAVKQNPKENVEFLKRLG